MVTAKSVQRLRSDQLKLEIRLFNNRKSAFLKQRTPLPGVLRIISQIEIDFEGGMVRIFRYRKGLGPI